MKCLTLFTGVVAGLVLVAPASGQVTPPAPLPTLPPRPATAPRAQRTPRAEPDWPNEKLWAFDADRQRELEERQRDKMREQEERQREMMQEQEERMRQRDLELADRMRERSFELDLATPRALSPERPSLPMAAPLAPDWSATRKESAVPDALD